ncbi:MAG TPA: hypothetical protein VNJ03_03845, partial [Vicinamibacterales bacterium]|nr:hypothetical protein [Vicinamibacterales bacterium]
SPDGTRIAAHVFEDGRDNWVVDLRRGSFMRLTFDPGEDETPIWSPDGTVIFWTSTRASVPRAIYRKAADGSGAEQTIWTGDGHVHIGGITPDGRTLVISIIRSQQTDLATIDVASGRLTPLLTTPFVKTEPALSRDGTWLAYTSNESGQEEVYVQPFPSMQGRTQVSAGGGSQAVWSRNGRQLFYRGNGKVMAVDVSTTGEFVASAPRPILDDKFDNPQGYGHTGYDVTSDGRFLVVARAVVSEAPTTHVRLVYRP